MQCSSDRAHVCSQSPILTPNHNVGTAGLQQDKCRMQSLQMECSSESVHVRSQAAIQAELCSSTA